MAIVVTPGQTVAGPDFEALLHQHGAGSSTQLRPPTKAEMDAAAPDDDYDQNPVYRQWTHDGSYVEYRKAPNGDYLIVDYKPSAKYTAAQTPAAQNQQRPTTGRVEGTPTGEKDAHGNPVYDNTKPIWVERDANNQQVGPAKPLTEQQRERWERDKNPGGKTDAEVRDATTKPRQTRVNPADPTKMQEFDPTTGQWVDAGVNAAGVQAAQDRNKPTVQIVPINGQQWTVRTTPQPNGQPPKVEWINPQTGQVAPPPVAAGKPHVEPVTIAGTRYTTVTTQNPDGSVKIEQFGPDGKPIAALPSEGAATAGGPPLPEIIVGSSEQALRDYHNALSKDPNLTPAQREKRFQEAVQTAQIAAQEAATQQRQREAELNASVNLASAKYSGMQTGQDNALKFVSDLNGKLPVGSNLGGQAFAALLGMNMLNAYGSGIMDVNVKSAFPTPAQLASARTPAEMETARQNVQAGLTQATAPAPAPATPAPVAPAAATPGTQTTIQPRPAPVAPVAAPRPTPGEPGGDPLLPGPVAPTPSTHVSPTATGPGSIGSAATDDIIQHGGTKYQPPGTIDPSTLRPEDPSNPNADVWVAPDGSRWRSGPNGTVVPAGDYRGTPPPPRPDLQNPGTGGGNVQMAPPVAPDFPVLAAAPAMAQQPLTPPIAQQSQQQDATPLPAMLYSEAAATPFWKMSRDQIERYRAAGVDEATIRSGTRLAGVA